MLSLKDKKIIIFTPNKCASTTVNETLTKELDAQIVLGPQGPWKELGFTYDDCIGNHSTFVPFWGRNWTKVMLVRNQYSRFISLWGHYCKYSDNKVGFVRFIEIIESMDIQKNWFYRRRMSDFINEAPKDTHLVDVEDLNSLNFLLETNITFPKLHTSEHDDYKSYYTPQLYRRVHDLS